MWQNLGLPPWEIERQPAGECGPAADQAPDTWHAWQVQRIADVRQNLGLPPEKQDGNLLESAALQLAPSQELLSTFISACAQRYQRKVVDAGDSFWN